MRRSSHRRFIDPMDVPDRIYHLLCRLGISMGIEQPYNSVRSAINYLAENPASLRPLADCNIVQLLVEYRQRFEKLAETNNGQEKVLCQAQYEIFMHLYWQLQHAVPNPAKRYNYMKFCFEIFETSQPEYQSTEDALRHRLQFIDRLNEQVNRLKDMLKVKADNDVSWPKIKRGTKFMRCRMNLVLRPRNNVRLLMVQQRQSVYFAVLVHARPLMCGVVRGFMQEMLKVAHFKKNHCSNDIQNEHQIYELPAELPRMQNVEDCHAVIGSRSVLDLFYALPGSKPYSKDAHEAHINHLKDFDQLNFMDQMFKYSQVLEKGKAGDMMTMPPDMTVIKVRVEPILEQIGKQTNAGQLANLRLQDFLTTSERVRFQSLCLQLANESHEADLLQAVRAALMGYEGKYLQRCPHTHRLHIRESQQQQLSVSDSYFLIALGKLGYYYRELKGQAKALRQLGQCGLALSNCIGDELANFNQYHKQLLQQPTSLLQLLCRTRGYQATYRWLLPVLQLCVAEQHSHALPWVLYHQLGHVNERYNELLCKWLVCLSQTVFQPICDWLLQVRLPANDKRFFITHNEHITIDNFWQLKYGLQSQYLPPFLSEVLANKMINIGKCLKYCQALQITLKEGISAQDLLPLLKRACEKWFQSHDDYPLTFLLDCMDVDRSSILLHHLGKIYPLWYQLLVLHKYILLSDDQFVSELMEHLALALEQPKCFYDAKLLDYMLEEAVGRHSSIYVSKAERDGDCCWSCFLLRCRLSTVWRPLLQHSMDRYDQLFGQLWILQRTNYVLRQRIMRQHQHFKQRINLELADVQTVQGKLSALMNQLLPFMEIVVGIVQKEWIPRALAQLEIGLASAKRLSEVVELHDKFLNDIDVLTFHNKALSRCWRFLLTICDVVFKLDAEQQKFIRLCHLLASTLYMHRVSPTISLVSERLIEFRWSCQDTYDALAALEEQFRNTSLDFLVALSFTRLDKFEKLADRLAVLKSEKEQKQMENFVSFEFIRKIKRSQ